MGGEGKDVWEKACVGWGLVGCEILPLPHQQNLVKFISLILDGGKYLGPQAEMKCRVLLQGGLGHFGKENFFCRESNGYRRP